MKTAAITVEMINSCGADISVVNAARVSFNKESDYEFDFETGDSKLSAKDVKLLNYLAKHKHFSPFNHAFLSFRVKAPIFVARQLVKHKFLPWNEVSRRYVNDEPEFFFPGGWRGKSDDKKQGSTEEFILPVSYVDMDNTRWALSQYNALLDADVAPEQARMVLPQNVMTEWIWSGTLGAFCDMLRLRLSKDTQEETRQVAVQIASFVSELFPHSYKALLE